MSLGLASLHCGASRCVKFVVSVFWCRACPGFRARGIPWLRRPPLIREWPRSQCSIIKILID